MLFMMTVLIREDKVMAVLFDFALCSGYNSISGHCFYSYYFNYSSDCSIVLQAMDGLDDCSIGSCCTFIGMQLSPLQLI